MFVGSLLILVLLAPDALCAAVDSKSTLLPVIDLGYALHEALRFNATGDYFNFSNIRYGAAPIGGDRFRAPKPPSSIDRTLTSGLEGDVTCPQGLASWQAGIGPQVTGLYEALAVQNLTRYEQILGGVYTNASGLDRDPGPSSGLSLPTGDTEDCLFLDVMLPRTTWEMRDECETRKAPVIVWLHGGGYVSGSKRNTGGNEVDVGGFVSGMVTRSTRIHTWSEHIEPTIIVSANYRLGMFGWLGGDAVLNDGEPNAGLLDQRLVFDWVQKYIHVFGGDRNRVTVMGESAGAGSIEHHLTSYGGSGGVLPFARAVLQSPTFPPRPQDDVQPQRTFERLLELSNTTSITALRSLSSESLQEMNRAIIANQTYGSFGFGPIGDGAYVPALPGQLFLQGRYHKHVSIMLGHNANEVFLFTSPLTQNTTLAFNEFVAEQFPGANSTSRTHIETALYPPIMDGSLDYVTTFGRQEQLYTDSHFVCNNLFMAEAYLERSYWYNFNIPPALHAFDLPYTWATYPPSESPSLNMTIAVALQKAILSFAARAEPAIGDGQTAFAPYSHTRAVLSFSPEGLTMAKDTTSRNRCAWWQRAPYASQSSQA